MHKISKPFRPQPLVEHRALKQLLETNTPVDPLGPALNFEFDARKSDHLGDVSEIISPMIAYRNQYEFRKQPLKLRVYGAQGAPEAETLGDDACRSIKNRFAKTQFSSDAIRPGDLTRKVEGADGMKLWQVLEKWAKKGLIAPLAAPFTVNDLYQGKDLLPQLPKELKDSLAIKSLMNILGSRHAADVPPQLLSAIVERDPRSKDALKIKPLMIHDGSADYFPKYDPAQLKAQMQTGQILVCFESQGSSPATHLAFSPCKLDIMRDGGFSKWTMQFDRHSWMCSTKAQEIIPLISIKLGPKRASLECALKTPEARADFIRNGEYSTEEPIGPLGGETISLWTIGPNAPLRE